MKDASSNYASKDAFVEVMCSIYCSPIEEKIKLSFRIYDFDEDNIISQEDARLILSYVPISSNSVSYLLLNVIANYASRRNAW